MKQNIKILHIADMQYKDRDGNKTISSYVKTTHEIERLLVQNNIDVYLFAGDILEYDNPTDAERNLMYQHFGRVLSLPNIKEVVVMNGNHDIKLGKNIELSQVENNPLNTFVESIKYINPESFEKLTYLKLQDNYKSKLTDKLGYLSYSLEDGKSTGDNLEGKIDANLLESQYTIPVFHDILYQYAIEKKLPVSQSKLNHLMKIENFKCSPNQKTLVLAGDIHENWSYKTSTEEYGDIEFVYPGSPIQRNYGEGTYCYITTSGPKFKPADRKVVKLVELNLDTENVFNTDYSISDVMLNHTLSYIKFDFNTKYVENWKEQLSKLCNDLIVSQMLSDDMNMIKVELSNVYMNEEANIIQSITEFFNTQKQPFNIEIIYGNVYFESNEEQKDINKILKEHKSQTNTDTDITDAEIVEDDVITELSYDFENTEDISLSQEDLKIVFESLLNDLSDNIRKEFTTEKEYQDVINELNSLFATQLDMSYGHKKSYDIELVSIETNGFMSLGPNKINLDIPGLTKIIGNNGIGKTTLYNMLRWVIRGYLLENLPKNTKKENLLLVFNDKLPDSNSIWVNLTCRINGNKVVIKRYANRTWKKSITENDKVSLQWRNHIDTATTTLMIEAHKDGNVLEQKDNEAQTTLDAWFGNTIENIFIINQFKLLALLNQNGDTLKETILDYIGVDYLRALQDNLAGIKEQYTVSKPSKAQVDIINEQNSINTELDEINNLKENGEIVIEELRDQISTLEIDKTRLNNEAINLGNVEMEIDRLEKAIATLQNDIATFEMKQPKEYPVFDELIQPQYPTDEQESLQLKIASTQENVNLFKEQQELLRSQFSKTKTETLNVLINKIDTLSNEMMQEVKEFQDRTKSQICEYQNNLKLVKETLLDNDLYKKIQTKIDKLNTGRDVLDIEVEQLGEQKLSIENQLANIKSRIENGVCSACKQSINLTKDDLDKLRNELDNLNNELETISNKRIDKFETRNALINKEIELSRLIQNYRNKLQETPIHNISTTQTELEFIKSDKHLSKLDLTEWESILNNMIQVYTEIDNYRIPEDKSNKVEELRKLKTQLEMFDIMSETLLESKNPKIILLNELNQKYVVIQKNMIAKSIELDDTRKSLSDLIENYNKELESYTTENNRRISLRDEITNYNDSIKEHNSSIGNKNFELKMKQQELLSKRNDLPKLNDIKNQMESVVKDLDKLHNEKSEKQKLLSEIDSKNAVLQERTNQLNQLKLDWIEYRKRTFVYKTFEKIIKNDFKQSVFNYYRNYLNTKLNLLLDGMNFRLFWNTDSSLYMVEIDSKSGEMIYRPVKLSSGMQTAFLGLSLIYCFHLLNIRNSISHIFIDEISGQLNSGKNLSGNDKNYQQQLVILLSKFDKKKVFIIDHVIDNLYETYSYNVNRHEDGLTYFE